jgi:hypothetical protein
MSLYKSVTIPKHIASKLPHPDLLKDVLGGHLIEHSARTELVRAVWNKASVWPEKVNQTYRYGPHESLKTVDGFPFYWIYAAEETLTAIWEAQLCVNPITHPGHFTLAKGAENALIVNLSFDQPLQLFDLSGKAVSKLGIYDQLRSPDYEWCNWFGLLMDHIISEHFQHVHGFVYPSRRHPGGAAYAISSHVHKELAHGLVSTETLFQETNEYFDLIHDKSFIARNML